MKTFLLISMSALFLSSCAVRVPLVKYEQKKEYGAKVVTPTWAKYPSALTWTSPLWLGGVAYGTGYLIGENQGKPQEDTRDLTLIYGGWTAGVSLFLVATTYWGLRKDYSDAKQLKNLKQIKVTDRDKWVKKYSKKEGLNYALKQEFPDGRLYLVIQGKNEYIGKVDPPPTTPTKSLKWQTCSNFDNKIFPSCVISYAELAGEDKDQYARLANMFGFKIYSEGIGESVVYEIEPVEENYMVKCSGEFLLKSGTNEYYPKIAWKFDNLKKITKSTNLIVKFRMKYKNAISWDVDKLVTFDVRNIYDCLLSVKGTQYSDLLAAYVDEENNFIQALQKDAIDKKYLSNWVSDQKSGSEIELQVEAIWKTICDYNIAYSTITGTAEFKNGIVFQPVRTFDDVFKYRQGNCIDLSVVFCSVLRKIGIRSFIVTIPRHAMFGYFNKDGEAVVVDAVAATPGTLLSEGKASANARLEELKDMEKEMSVIFIDVLRNKGLNPLNAN